jgi:hypothetical protein
VLRELGPPDKPILDGEEGDRPPGLLARLRKVRGKT